MYVMEDGREAVACHRGDGWGIGILQQAGIEVIILSTESNPVVSARAEKLGIECHQNCSDKTAATAALILDVDIRHRVVALATRVRAHAGARQTV